MDHIPSQQDGSAQHDHDTQHSHSGQYDDNDLPTVLAEYGHLAAQLPSASRRHAEILRARLATLDELIDQHITRLSIRRSTVDNPPTMHSGHGESISEAKLFK